MAERLQLYNMTEKKIRGDGNCQFRSVADQITDSEVSFYAYIYIYIYIKRAHDARTIFRLAHITSKRLRLFYMTE